MKCRYYLQLEFVRVLKYVLTFLLPSFEDIFYDLIILGRCREDHPESVLSAMQTIMVVLLEESEDIRDELLFTLLSTLGRNKSVSSLLTRTCNFFLNM